jgi:hypothetical protein
VDKIIYEDNVKYRENNFKVVNIDGVYDYWRHEGGRQKTSAHPQNKHKRHEEQIIFQF